MNGQACSVDPIERLTLQLEVPVAVHLRRVRHLCSSVAQRQSIRLLTGGLLVRIQPEEPITSWSILVG
jgi:hypothetical protein